MKKENYFVRAEYIDGVPMVLRTRTGGPVCEQLRLVAMEVIADIKATYTGERSPLFFYEVYFDDIYGRAEIIILDFDRNAPITPIQDTTKVIYDEDGYGSDYLFEINLRLYPFPEGTNDYFSPYVYLRQKYEGDIEKLHKEIEKETEENLKLMCQRFVRNKDDNA